MTAPSTFAFGEAAGRGADYVEIGLDSPYRYNPLHNDLDAYALAYTGEIPIEQVRAAFSNGPKIVVLENMENVAAA